METHHEHGKAMRVVRSLLRHRDARACACLRCALWALQVQDDRDGGHEDHDPHALQVLGKCFVQFLWLGASHSGLVYCHSSTVNPRELIVATQFFLTLVSEDGLQKAPLTLHFLPANRYTTKETTTTCTS